MGGRSAFGGEQKNIQNTKTQSGNYQEKLFGMFHLPEVFHSIAFALLVVLGSISPLVAFTIRTIAIKQFGTVIHEFDPWFNYRSTEYLHENGWRAFLNWYDYQSWYPLGRPVGPTTYPGLQVTAVAIHAFFSFLGKSWRMSLNDICCYIPAWFGSLSTVLVGFLAYECTRSKASSVFAAIIMAVIPSHIVRTVGGGFDNESVAIPAMCAVFYFWTCALHRDEDRPYYKGLYGVLAGVSYGYMASAWGGFVYVTNIIALHTAILLLWDWIQGQYCVRLYQTYTIYFLIGTLLAMCVPPVGMTPFKSLEQISSLLVFLAMQVLHFSELHRHRIGILSILSRECFMHRLRYIFFFALVGIFACGLLDAGGFFGPLTARVHSLIMQHRSTGNPLVDSVAEHQPMSVEGLWMYSSYAFYFTPIGAVVAVCSPHFRKSSFMLLNLIVSWHFAMKMSRLIIFSSIPCAVLSGTFLGKLVDKAWKNIFWSNPIHALDSRKRIHRQRNMGWYARFPLDKVPRVAFTVVASVFLYSMSTHASLFAEHCWESAIAHSQPQIVFHHFDGTKHVLVDDYRESYRWLREQTPSDSRVLAWWDYGYHITGIANRTSLADGNTWNHEHIALIGKCLCSPVSDSHAIIRHLADYVLLWTGGGADDLAKSPWIARISNSVFDDVCPNDPLCSEFGFRPNGSPSPLMEKSTLYSLQRYSEESGVTPLNGLFETAYISKHGLVTIYKVLNVSSESKEWVLKDTKRRRASKDKSYHGTYPPAQELQSVLQTGRQMGN